MTLPFFRSPTQYMHVSEPATHTHRVFQTVLFRMDRESESFRVAGETTSARASRHATGGRICSSPILINHRLMSGQKVDGIFNAAANHCSGCCWRYPTSRMSHILLPCHQYSDMAPEGARRAHHDRDQLFSDFDLHPMTAVFWVER